MTDVALDVAGRAAQDAEAGRNVYDVLAERGFIAQTNDGDGLRAALERPVTLYCGYDATGASLHIGHQLTLMALAHFQRAGHRPITLLGGGTTMIGDPTDRAAQRPILTEAQIERNIAALRPQFARFLDFGEGAGPGRARLLDNADWLLGLKYIEFLRDIGKHFSVNQLLSHSTYRERLERGSLNFIEINYVLLQAYDFLHLYRELGCTVQLGGGDQWFNVLAGADLIRRVAGGQAFALVAPLLTTSSGEKMGKTTSGAAGIWLDPALTSPYDYYQHWINVPDAQVEQRLKLYTFLPLDEIARLTGAAGADPRRAKEALAFEATRIAHGEDEARQARDAARALFGGGDGAATGEGIPTVAVPRAALAAGLPLVELLVTAGLCASKGAARRLIAQGGAYVNGAGAPDPDARLTLADLAGGHLLLRAGKKRYARVVAEG
jgi:tyrosyl-tRNA synthetase